jgi:hypothetical protein
MKLLFSVHVTFRKSACLLKILVNILHGCGKLININSLMLKTISELQLYLVILSLKEINCVSCLFCHRINIISLMLELVKMVKIIKQ